MHRIMITARQNMSYGMVTRILYIQKYIYKEAAKTQRLKTRSENEKYENI